MNLTLHRLGGFGVLALAVALLAAACGGNGDDAGPTGEGDSLRGAELLLYSGRNQNLVQPALDAFEEQTGIKVKVRYASSAAIAATILEEGRNSPADVVLLQDAGALGALAGEGVLDRLDDELLGRVDAKFRSPEGLWVGTSGRARTVIYNTEAIDPETDLPDSILGFTDPKWKGRIGWAPTNGSFQAFVTALRVQLGEEGARSWLKGVKANKPKAFSSNTPIVAAVEAGEIDVGFVNHYYLHRFLDERGEGFKARNYYYTGGDPGALVNVAGVGILRSSDAKAAARRFIDYMLGVEAQTYFATQTHEFPLAANVPSPEGVPSLQQLDPPDIDLSNLADLRGTLDLLRDVGILN